jgi:hypothetical protein
VGEKSDRKAGGGADGNAKAMNPHAQGNPGSGQAKGTPPSETPDTAAKCTSKAFSAGGSAEDMLAQWGAGSNPHTSWLASQAKGTPATDAAAMRTGPSRG